MLLESRVDTFTFYCQLHPQTNEQALDEGSEIATIFQPKLECKVNIFRCMFNFCRRNTWLKTHDGHRIRGVEFKIEKSAVRRTKVCAKKALVSFLSTDTWSDLCFVQKQSLQIENFSLLRSSSQIMCALPSWRG